MGLIITTLSRIFLLYYFYPRMVSSNEYWILFPIGWRIDLILLSYISIVPSICILLIPDHFLAKWNDIIRVFFIFCFHFLILMEIATPSFLSAYDTPLNNLLIEFSSDSRNGGELTSEGVLSIFNLWFLNLFLIMVLIVKKSKNWFAFYPAKSYGIKILFFPLVICLFFFIGRNSLSAIQLPKSKKSLLKAERYSNDYRLGNLNKEKRQKDIKRQGN